MIRKIAAVLMMLALLGAPAIAADRKPQVIGASGRQQEIQATDTLQLPAATTANASLNLPQGTAPTSPANGDVWLTTLGMYARVNGATVGPFGAGGGSLTLTDGTHTVAGVTQITVSGGTVGGTTPNATLAVAGGGGGGSVTQIATVTTSGSATSIAFSSIPPSYKTIWIQIFGKNTVSNQYGLVQFNGDAGNHYSYVFSYWYGGGTGGSSGGGPTTTAAPFAFHGADIVFEVNMYIMGYNSTLFHKQMQSNSTLSDTSFGTMYFNSAITWNNGTTPVAITSILFTLQSGAFVDGTVATLYGIS